MIQLHTSGGSLLLVCLDKFSSSLHTADALHQALAGLSPTPQPVSLLFQLSGKPRQSSPSCNVFREVVGFPHSNTRASLKNVDTVPLITFLLHSVIIFQFVLVGISSPFVNVQIFLYEISEIIYLQWCI